MFKNLAPNLILTISLIAFNIMYVHISISIVLLIIVMQYTILLILKKVSLLSEFRNYLIVMFTCFSLLILYGVFIEKTASNVTLSSISTLMISLFMLDRHNSKNTNA